MNQILSHQKRQKKPLQTAKSNEKMGMTYKYHHEYLLKKIKKHLLEIYKTYLRLINEFRINPQQTVFFEDIEKNLEPAHKLGITTVHIGRNSYQEKVNNSSKYIDYRFNCINSALKSILDNIAR